MMNDGMNIEQRDIVLLPFPFSDLSSSKKRPAFVVSNTDFNKDSEDIVCCLITSNPNAGGIKIKNNDLESGLLKFESVIKPYRIFAAEKSIIYKNIGKLKKEKGKIVEKEIRDLVKMK